MDWEQKDSKLSDFNAARYWDYLLGGHYNFEVDRAAGDRVIQASPDTRLGALANRSFLRRSVRYLAQQGIDQFIDLGSGIPTVGNVHEIAQKVNPGSHTVYVDKDPVAVTHSRSIIIDDPNSTVIEEDFLNFNQLIQKPEVTRLISFKKPIGILLVAVMHFLPDDSQAYGLLRTIHSVIPVGSYVVISHYSLEQAPQVTIEKLSALKSSTSNSSKQRSRLEVERFFEGFKIIEPGVVWVPTWQPEAEDELLVQEPARSLSFCGVGLKR